MASKQKKENGKKKEKKVSKKKETKEIEESSEKELKMYVPTPDSVGKSFQMDNYGNFRIVVNGMEGEWVGNHEMATVDVGTGLYIGVLKSFKGNIPAESVLRVEKVEEGENKKADIVEKKSGKKHEDFVQVKIFDKESKRNLDVEEIEDILDSILLKREFDFVVKGG